VKSLPPRAMWPALFMILSLSSLAAAGPGNPAAPAGTAGTARSAPDSAGAGRSAPAGTAAHRATPRASGNAFLQVGGPAGAHVLIKGKEVGRLPLGGPLALAPGDYLVEGELGGYAPFHEEMDFENPGEQVLLQLRLIPLHRRDALFYSLVLAGLGENYVGRPVLGYALSAAEVGGVVAAIGGQLLYTNHRNDYLVLYDAYRHAVSDADVASRRAEAQDAWNKMRNAQSLRNTGLLVAAGSVVVGMLDSWLRFPSIEAGPGATAAAAGAGAGAELAERADPIAAPSAHVACTLRF